MFNARYSILPHTVYSYVSYDSDTTEPLFPTATFTDHYSQWEHIVYPVRCLPKVFGGLVLTNPDVEGVGRDTGYYGALNVEGI